mmetsp:Transcript_12056/g.21816  ORF Transcript_12056/g.21816 Transcript_12056/m.21816 type:complete len:89 (-) Transcript_12056:888-1154(-)
MFQVSMALIQSKCLKPTTEPGSAQEETYWMILADKGQIAFVEVSNGLDPIACASLGKKSFAALLKTVEVTNLSDSFLTPLNTSATCRI